MKKINRMVIKKILKITSFMHTPSKLLLIQLQTYIALNSYCTVMIDTITNLVITLFFLTLLIFF